MPLALKLPNFKCLTCLDLSYNKMDNSSESIMNYLRSPSCTLTALLLNGAGEATLKCYNICVDSLFVVPVCYTHSIHSALHHSDFQIARKRGEIFYTTTSIYNNPILWLRNIVTSFTLNFVAIL